MQVDAIAVRLRPRAPLEAADLGVRICQSRAGSVFRCYAVVMAPTFILCLATVEIATWLPSLLLWWAKPWLDRTVVFVLSRAAFGVDTSLSDLWDARKEVWWRQLIRTWTLRRLSPWRSFTQPVYQLEGSSWRETARRVRQIRGKRSGSALLMTSAFSVAELCLTVAVLFLLFWFVPQGVSIDVESFLTGEASTTGSIVTYVAYALAVAFLEPFYAAAGFAMYLNRRAELEAWDIEQELRRAFAR